MHYNNSKGPVLLGYYDNSKTLCVKSIYIGEGNTTITTSKYLHGSLGYNINQKHFQLLNNNEIGSTIKSNVLPRMHTDKIGLDASKL